MEKQLIGRGILAGALAGLLAYVFARVFAEPVISSAIDYESGRDAAQALLDRAAGLAVSPAEAEPISRAVQADVGSGVALILFGAAMGALFAVAYVVCIGRVGRVRPRPLALLVGAAGFVGVFLVPFVKYPANPPAVGHEETVRDRGLLFLAMTVISVVLLLAAVVVGRRLAPRLGSWRAALVAGAGFLVLVGVAMALLPAIGHLSANVELYGRHATETPLPLRDADGQIVYPGFPADLLYRFRLYAVGTQLILWATIALVFAPLADRLLTRESRERTAALAGR